MAKDGVDGVYSADPKKFKSAKRFDHLTFKQAIKMKLQFMDMSAMHICQKKHINILVFNMKRHDAIIKATKRLIPTTVIDNR
jgi:uridylate kinase